MPRLKSANFAVTELASNITNNDTSFTVTDASAFPDTAPFLVIVHDNTPGFGGVKEIMEVGAINKSANTFSSVLRGREGTAAVAHNAGERVENVWTAGTHQELADKPFLFTGTLSTSGWTGTSAPYTQTVTVTGILASAPPPVIDVELSATWSTALSEEEAWGLIKRITYANNSLTFYADAKPTVALNFKGVQVK